MKRSYSHRRPASWLLAALCLLLGAPARADVDEVRGTWKLVVLAFGADEFAILDIHKEDDKAKGTLIDAQKRVIGNVKLGEVKVEGETVTVDLDGPAGLIRFSGNHVHEGLNADKILGTVNFMGEVYPAQMEKTKEEKLGDAKQSPIIQDFLKAVREQDAKTKVAKLQELAVKNAGAPSSQIIYTEILASADDAGLTAADVEKLVQAWQAETKPYGEAWTNEVRLKALKPLAATKTYAETALKLAQEADKAVAADAPVAAKATIVGLLAAAAKNAGKADVAAEAVARGAKLDAELDAEYHTKVPPFKPVVYEGRKKDGANQSVVFELFTGAQCPPCVAADVAFDGLLKTYKPTDFIGLQYHLHIPGPDPLTNNDAIARQKYYGDEVRGTPSTFFNGKSESGGGGPMAASEAKYDEYRGLVDEILEGTKKADVTLSAKRQGDQIEITAEAVATAVDKPKNGEKTPSQLKLRLALTEESVRYVGGNKLRFHHHVVRALPGGADGKGLVDGKGRVEIKLNLADLKKELDEYVSDFAKNRPFPATPPEVALKNLSVVAFVQDDSDKSILGAVSTTVEEATP